MNAPATKAQPMEQQGQQIDYNQNLMMQNGEIQQLNNDNYNRQRRQGAQKGVQAKQAY
jgi:hypothetical protein